MDIDKKIKYYDKLLVLFEDNEVSRKMMLYFINTIKSTKKEGLIIVSKESMISSNVLEVVILNIEEIRRLYQLYKFTDKIIWGSFSKPYGRHWSNLIDSGCITEEQGIEGVLNF